ncbi:hypothetical protein Pla123a_31090 [Posidoniimonas polymericola]|uniref:ImpA N-terminal domain-containing protein n=1 Tax=Posidoniimonas polymericola TaxID=2528002 RepID=A0A5C5YLC3_9BACT|nr:type VI secretion system protein TssA [Posidoniimonas polymericola]TWT75599.1 hypothetical protein Pla123a_31090 [Posidoniimonas polymericola]
MPSATCEALLLPLPGDSPTGDEAHFAMTLSPLLRELRREEQADHFDDATRPKQLKRAEWAKVVEQCESALTEHAKDLRTACHLVEARTRVDGLRGLSEGLELVARMVEECWDRVSPAVGDDPIENRATPLANLLDDAVRGLCFPNQIITLPLIGAGENACSFVDWTKMRGDSEQGEALSLRRAKITPEVFKQNHDHAAAALHWLERLRKSLDERLGEDAPGLLKLRNAISDLHGLLADELSRLGFATEPNREPDGGHSPEELKPTTLGPAARDQLYTLLDNTAEQLRAMEPHSPIPYLIKRAVRLGRLPFPSLMQHVIREQTTLAELNREFGIAEADGVEASA